MSFIVCPPVMYSPYAHVCSILLWIAYDEERSEEDS